MSEFVNISHCGKLGDFLLSLPVCSWVAKDRGKKINFVLAERFEPFHKIPSLLMLQPMTGSVSLAPLPVSNWSMGGQPFEHDLGSLGYEGESICMGFKSRPSAYVPEFLAESLGLGVDQDFQLNLGEYEPSSGVAATERLRQIQATIRLRVEDEVLKNAQLFAGAKERHCHFSAMAILMDLAGFEYHLHNPVEKELGIFLRDGYRIAS